MSSIDRWFPRHSILTFHRRLLATLAVGLLSGLGAARAAETTLRVSAASSLGDVLKVINKKFEVASGVKVELNLAASNVLARQIDEGAPVDVFFSADLAKMDTLTRAGRIVVGTVRARLSNALVVVTPADSGLAITSGADLSGAAVKRIAIGDPKAVPAGIYAKQWLTQIGIWAAIEPKLVPTESVRAALAAVESGNVEAGIVYQTDAAISPKVRIALRITGPDAPQITYPAALVQDARELEAGQRYLQFLDSKAAQEVFVQHGFVVLPSSAEK